MIAPANGIWPQLSPSRTRTVKDRGWRRSEEAESAIESGVGGVMALLSHVLDLSRQSAACYAFGADDDGAFFLEARWPLLSRLGELLGGGEVEETGSSEREWAGTGEIFDAAALVRLASAAAELGRLDAEIERWSGSRGNAEG